MHALYGLKVLVEFPSKNMWSVARQNRPSHLNLRIQESINQVKLILQLYVEQPALGLVTHGSF